MRETSTDIEVLALDLEGTLISNAVSQIPRPGLHEFLVGCAGRFSRMVMFTTVPEPRFRDIARTLADEGSVPDWFPHLEYVQWHGTLKDLGFVPDAAVRTTVIVDDCEDVIPPGQKGQWAPVPLFAYPYDEQDGALKEVLMRLPAHSDGPGHSTGA